MLTVYSSNTSFVPYRLLCSFIIKLLSEAISLIFEKIFINYVGALPLGMIVIHGKYPVVFVEGNLDDFV